jgi:hypothetical protein
MHFFLGFNFLFSLFLLCLSLTLLIAFALLGNDERVFCIDKVMLFLPLLISLSFLSHQE